MKEVKAIAFDIDGTMYPNLRMYFHSLPYFFSKFSMLSHFSKVRKDLRTMDYEGDFHLSQAKLFALRTGMETEEAKTYIERVFYKGWGEYFGPGKISLFKDFPESVLKLKSLGLKLAAMSDFPIGDKLKKLGVGEYFDIAFSTEDTGRLKPSKVPFEELIKKLKMKPEEILYVGNNYCYDVEGAAALGMKSAYLKGFGKSQGIADIGFRSYKEFNEKFLELYCGGDLHV